MTKESGVGIGYSQRSRAGGGDDYALFVVFLRSCRPALKRISAHSRGDSEALERSDTDCRQAAGA